MKYRVLTPEEMEAYKIGYKVGARELFITGQEWDSEEEHRIYRKGYNAGCKDRERKNLKPELLDKSQQCQQCQQCLTCDSQDSQDSQDCVYPIDTVIDDNNNTRNSNKGGMGGKEKGGFVPPTLEEVLEYARQQNSFAGVGGFACTDEQATDFFNQYDRQGWLLGNGIHMANWRSGLMKWAQNKQPPTNKFGQRLVKMTAKEIKEAENHMKLQKMLNGEL